VAGGRQPSAGCPEQARDGSDAGEGAGAVAPGHPFVYQRHVFVGGEGRVTFANHANISVKGGAHIRTSPKHPLGDAEDPAGRATQRAGAPHSVCPAQATDPARVSGAGRSGRSHDLPLERRGREDFVVGIEAKGHAVFGWTAVSRIGAGDLYLSLRDPRRVPMTMLWHSNGGRDYRAVERAASRLPRGRGRVRPIPYLGLSAEADLAGPRGARAPSRAGSPRCAMSSAPSPGRPRSPWPTSPSTVTR
jgi:hypothetical protein